MSNSYESKVTKISENITELISFYRFSNKFKSFNERIMDNISIQMELLDSIQTRDNYTTFVEDIEKLLLESDIIIYDIIQLYKNNENFTSLLEQIMIIHEQHELLLKKMIKAANKKYLDANGRLSKLALEKLPKTNEQLAEEITNKNNSNSNSKSDNTIIELYLTAVEFERKKI